MSCWKKPKTETEPTPRRGYQPRPLISYAVHVVAKHIRREDLARIPADLRDHIERHMRNCHTHQELFGMRRIWHTYGTEQANRMKETGWCFSGAIACEPCYRRCAQDPAVIQEEWFCSENHRMHGTMRKWDEYGTLVLMETYRHGTLHGPSMSSCAERRSNPTEKFEYKTITGNYDKGARVGKWVRRDAAGHCLQVAAITKLDPPQETAGRFRGERCSLSWRMDLIHRDTHGGGVRYARRWYIKPIKYITTDIDTGDNWGMQIVEYYNEPVGDGGIARDGSAGRSHDIRKIASLQGCKKHGVQVWFNRDGTEEHRMYYVKGTRCDGSDTGEARTLEQVRSSANDGCLRSTDLTDLDLDFERLFVLDLANYPTLAEIKAQVKRSDY